MKQKLKQLTALVLAFTMSMSLLCSSTWAEQLDSTQIENIPVRGEESVSTIANDDEEQFDCTDEECAVESDTNSEDTIEFEESNNSEEAKNEDNMIGATVEPIASELTSETEKEVHLETASTTPTSGSCGKNAKWSYDKSKKTLTISGTGDMYEAEHYPDWEMPYSTYLYGNIEKIVIAKGITNISSGAFFGTSATSVSIADTVTSIQDTAFSFSELVSVSIPKSVKMIGEDAFHLSNVKNIELTEGLQEIGDGAFSATKIKSITIPKSVTKIGGYTFAWSSLSSISLPDTIKTIPEGCFAGSEITEIMLPSAISCIGAEAFAGCKKLKNIYFLGNAPRFGESCFGNFYELDDDYEPNTYVTATAYYPQNNSTWTSSKSQNYGGRITWKPLRKLFGMVVSGIDDAKYGSTNDAALMYNRLINNQLSGYLNDRNNSNFADAK